MLAFIRTTAARDMAALVLGTLWSLAWYAPQLGFYSDDWAFLGRYATAPDQSLAGFFEASYSSQHAMRPVQLWMCAALYRWFGLEPLGYHLFNSVLVLSLPLWCYAIARELGVPRIAGFSVALLYALLPNYSTDRLWYVAFAITFSMSACLAGIYADIRAAASTMWASIAWKAAAAAAFIVSGLAYEVALPLILLTPLLMLWRAWRIDDTTLRKRIIHIAALAAVNVILLCGLAVFKLRMTVRLGADQGIATQVIQIARDAWRWDVPAEAYGLNVFSAIAVHFGEYGVGLPATALAAGRLAPEAVLWMTPVIGVAVYLYLRRIIQDEPWPSLTRWLCLTGGGVAVFALGYAIFLTNYNVQFTAAGIANRSAIAATLGAAMCTIGIIGAALSFPRRFSIARNAFAASVAILAAAGMLIINVVAAQWIVAWQKEQQVLADIRLALPTLPAQSTIVLDGVCPYIGPAVVFEAPWDLAGALQTRYGDPTLAGDVVSNRLTVNDEAITTTLYGQPTHHRYGSNLMVYNAASRSAHVLRDATSARAYFEAQRSSRPPCPEGHEGIGVPIF